MIHGMTLQLVPGETVMVWFIIDTKESTTRIHNKRLWWMSKTVSNAEKSVSSCVYVTLGYILSKALELVLRLCWATQAFLLMVITWIASTGSAGASPDILRGNGLNRQKVIQSLKGSWFPTAYWQVWSNTNLPHSFLSFLTVFFPAPLAA